MIEVVNNKDGNAPVRVIFAKPKERREGYWVKDRKYPLYSVVENNGSTFM